MKSHLLVTFMFAAACSACIDNAVLDVQAHDHTTCSSGGNSDWRTQRLYVDHSASSACILNYASGATVNSSAIVTDSLSSYPVVNAWDVQTQMCSSYSTSSNPYTCIFLLTSSVREDFVWEEPYPNRFVRKAYPSHTYAADNTPDYMDIKVNVNTVGKYPQAWIELAFCQETCM